MPTQTRKTFVQKWMPSLIAAGILAFGIFSYEMITETQSARKNEADRRVLSLQNQLDARNIEISQQKDDVYKKTTGYDEARVDKDASIMNAFFKTAFNWDSFSEYSEARETLKEEYNLADDSSFLTRLMPEIEEYEDENGKTTNQIKASNLNMTFSGMTPTVMSINDNDSYTYFTTVSVTSSDQQKGKATGKILFIYTLSKDGTLSGLEAFTTEG